MRKILASVLAVIMLCPLSTLAAGRVPSGSETVRSATEIRDALAAVGIGPGAEVSVTLRDRSVITGRVDYVGSHSLFVMDSGNGSVTQVSYLTVSQLKVGSPSRKAQIIFFSVLAAVMAYLLVVVKEF